MWIFKVRTDVSSFDYKIALTAFSTVFRDIVVDVRSVVRAFFNITRDGADSAGP